MDGRTRNTISLVCPVRGRPDYLPAHIMSIAETAADPARLELLFYVDRDDPQAAAYEALFAEIGANVFPGLALVAAIGDRIGLLRAHNHLAARARGDILMISSDDVQFVTKGWDAAIDAAAARYADGIFNIYFDDGYFGETLSSLPIVSRTWYRALGYFAPVVFEHYVADWWIHHLGKFLDRNVYLPDVRVEHRHTAAEAAGHRFEWDVEGPVKRKMDRDNAYFQIFERYLRADADLLRDVIAGRPARHPIPDEAFQILAKSL